MAEGSSLVLMHDARPPGSPHSSSPSGGGPGGASGVVPPVPFPNTVVKRPSANDTAWATAWDNRPVPGPPLTSFSQDCYSDRSGANVPHRARAASRVGGEG